MKEEKVKRIASSIIIINYYNYSFAASIRGSPLLRDKEDEFAPFKAVTKYSHKQLSDHLPAAGNYLRDCEHKPNTNSFSNRARKQAEKHGRSWKDHNQNKWSGPISRHTLSISEAPETVKKTLLHNSVNHP